MHLRALTSVAALVAAVLLAGSVPLRAQDAAPAGAGPLPPGNGRDIVATACSQCHSLTAVTHLRQGATAWKHQVYDMIGRGAQVAPGDIDVVVTYLASNFGPGIPFPGATPAHVDLASGTGETLVATRCVLCHGADRVVAVGRTAAQWRAIVARMQYLGAPLSPADAATVDAYLAANYGPAAAKN